ncbi:MAG: phytase, partial [Actinomycetota bacterium]|nr:phytase [Actinomycetota bacterium]
TTIDSGPSATTNSRSARLAFSSSEPGSTFECRLDAAAFAPCTSPKDYADLADAQHTFEVRAIDAAGHVDPSPASRTWTVDGTAPTVSAVRPAEDATDVARDALVEAELSEAMNPATLTSATFSLRREGAGEDVPAAVAYDPATRRASLDPSADLESAATYTATLQGGEGGAKDAAGNPLAADRTWSFSTSAPPDTTPPETTVDSGPSGTTNSRSARLGFSSSEPGSTFECRLDAAAFAPCTSPTDYADLADGQHTFEVRATDAAGNADPSPASRTWTVDGTAPTVSAVRPAEDATDIARDALVEADFSEAMSPATLTSTTFSLRRQGAGEDVPATVAYDPATRRASLDPSTELEPATTYTATVRGGEAGAKDAAANPLAADRTWSFSTSAAPDTTPPETTVDSGPSATTNSRSARLGFSSSEPGSTFECRLDAAAFAPCTSPKDYADLADGQHTFEVRATDGAGNLDQSPASRTWTVDGTAPTVRISSPPSGTTYTSAQAVQIQAAVSPDTQRVEFYDNGVLKGTEDTDPFAFTWSIDESDNGTHSWTIKAFDGAGNVSVESAPVTLIVNVAGGGGGTSRSVTASVETAPVAGRGDAADDPAVWIHPTDTSKSTIIGTEKVDGGGLVVYDLAGNKLHKSSDTTPNNVDLRYNFPLGGERVGLVAASNNQATKTLRLYKVNPSTRGLEHVSAREIATGVAAGLCMYHSRTSGKYYAFVSDNSGTLQQWELFESAGKVDATKVRTIRLGSTTEGCVADDETGKLYISEEDVAIWKYGAEPTDGATTAARTKVDDLTGAGGRLTNDIEGLSIYYGNGGTGYLLASSQGSGDYVVYDRQSGEYVTRFSVVDGAVDGTSYTDGIDVTNFPLGGSFPEGMFIAQDDENTSPSESQNFKLVPWGRIARGGSPALKVDTSWDPRQVGAPARNQAPTAAFGASPSSPLTGE